MYRGVVVEQGVLVVVVQGVLVVVVQGVLVVQGELYRRGISGREHREPLYDMFMSINKTLLALKR